MESLTALFDSTPEAVHEAPALATPWRNRATKPFIFLRIMVVITGYCQIKDGNTNPLTRREAFQSTKWWELGMCEAHPQTAASQV